MISFIRLLNDSKNYKVILKVSRNIFFYNVKDAVNTENEENVISQKILLVLIFSDMSCYMYICIYIRVARILLKITNKLRCANGHF